MSLKKRFNGWVEKMRGKSEEEKHAIAVTISLFLGAIIASVVIMNWYFTLTGLDPKENLFNEFSEFYMSQKSAIDKLFNN